MVHNEQEEAKEQTAEIKSRRWFRRGVYGSKSVPIRILDGLIIGAIAAIIILIIVFALNGGYHVYFETYGGSEVVSQNLRYGTLAQEPEAPQKPGYEFVRWMNSEDESLAEEWNFSEDKVEGDVTLYAVWKPAQITVKFDLNGGNVAGDSQIAGQTVTFEEDYGELPVPERTGYEFDGWEYSGNIIESDTIVVTSGEHVLTARWR